MRRWLCVVSLGALLLSRGVAQAAPDSTLISFSMEDQFKQVHTDSSFRDTALLVLVANKGGSKYSRKWSPALRDSLVSWQLNDRVNLLGVATMKGVPFFLKGMVKGKLPKEPKDWMLLDWKGEFAKAYECKGDTCHVLIFDTRGWLRHRLTVGEVASSEMTAIQDQLKLVIGSPVPRTPGQTPSPEAPR